MIIDNADYKNLLKHFQKKINGLSKDDKEIILKTFEVSKKCHKGFIYGPDQPFIVHPLRVALIVLNLKIKNKDMICAALLHDTVEDTDMTYDEIEKLFNKVIVNYLYQFDL